MPPGNVPFPARRVEANATWDADESARKTEEQKSRAESSSTALVSSSTAASSSGLEIPKDPLWDQLAFGRYLRAYQAYAMTDEDVHLVSSFLELTPLTHLIPQVAKLLLRVMRFLRLCDYHVEDMCVILAHASAYFLDFYCKRGSQLEDDEIGNVLGSLIYIAHCYVQDETCPLSLWHQHLFRRYCDLKTLNAAVIQLMKLRHYQLRLSDEDLTTRMSKLEGSIRCFGNLEASFSRLNPAASRSRLVDVAVRPKHPMASNGYPRPKPEGETTAP